jgi:hypothetical protein
MTCDEWKQKICCRSLPCIQLVSALINRLPSVFWVKRSWWMRVGVQEFWPFFTQPSLPRGLPIQWQKCLCNVTERCVRELDLSTWLFCPNLFSAPLSVLLSLSTTAILQPYCSGAGWPLFLLVTIVVTPYGLVSTLTVTCHATTARW